MGGYPGQTHSWREPGDPHVDRYAIRINHGPARIACEADGYSMDAESERPSDYSQQQAKTGRSQNGDGPETACRQGQDRRGPADVCNDICSGHACDVDSLLAG